MGEIKTPEIKEVNKTKIEDYKDIKPEGKISADECRSFIKDIFSNVNNLEQKQENTELTDTQRQEIKEKIGWPDSRIDKCSNGENGNIRIKTLNEDLEGKKSENGVPFVKKVIEICGIKIQGVFPVFKSAFDTELSPDNYKTSRYKIECNANLKEAVAKDPQLAKTFTKEQLAEINAGKTPSGYAWHHNEEPGKMQLVKREDHDSSNGAVHTGGNSLWGYESVDRSSRKGETF